MAFSSAGLSSTPHNPSLMKKSHFLSAFHRNSSPGQFPLLKISNKRETKRTFGKKNDQQQSPKERAKLHDHDEESLSDITVDEPDEIYQPPREDSLCVADKFFDISADGKLYKDCNEAEAPTGEASLTSSGKKNILDASTCHQAHRAEALDWGLWRCPVLSELIRGLTDACAFHQWDLVLALLPCIAIRCFPMLSFQYAVEMATALENCGALQMDSILKQLKYLAPRKTVQLLSSIVQRYSKKQTDPPGTSSLSNMNDSPPSLDIDTEAVLQDWDKLLNDTHPRVQRGNDSKQEVHFEQAYKGILCYVRWKKMEHNTAMSSDKTNVEHIIGAYELTEQNSDALDITDFALRELTRDVEPEDLADQAVLLMEAALDVIPEPCEWLLLPLLECLERSRGTTASHAAASKYLQRHSYHAPAFCAVLKHALTHWPEQASTHVAILKHVQQLSPGADQVLHLVQIVLDDPRSYETVSSEEALGLTPVEPEAGGASEGPANYSLCVTPAPIRPAQQQEEVCNSSLLAGRGRNLLQKSSSGSPCPLLKDVVVRSRVYCVRILVRLLHMPHHRHTLRPWELLSRALACLHRAWIRCWDCRGCRKSREDLVPVVTVWWWLWWRQLALAHSGAGPQSKEGPQSQGLNLKCDADAKLVLNRAVVAHILCIDASSDVWWSALSSNGWVGLSEELRECVFRIGPHAHHFTQYRAAVIRRRQEMFGKDIPSSVQLRPPIGAEFPQRGSPSGNPVSTNKNTKNDKNKQRKECHSMENNTSQEIQPNALPSSGGQSNLLEAISVETTAPENELSATSNRGDGAIESEMNDLGTSGNCSAERQRMLEQRLTGGNVPATSEWARPFPVTRQLRVRIRSDAEKSNVVLPSPIISRIAPLMSDSEDCNASTELQVGRKGGRVFASRAKKATRSKAKAPAKKDNENSTAKSNLASKTKPTGDKPTRQRTKAAAPRGKKTSATEKKKETAVAINKPVNENQHNDENFTEAHVQNALNFEHNLDTVESRNMESNGQEILCPDNSVKAVESRRPTLAVEDSGSAANSPLCKNDFNEKLTQTCPQSTVEDVPVSGTLASQSIPCGQVTSSNRLSISLHRENNIHNLTNENLSPSIDKVSDYMVGNIQPSLEIEPTHTDVPAATMRLPETDPHSPDIIPASVEYEGTDWSVPKLLTTKSLLGSSASGTSRREIFDFEDTSNCEAVRASHQNSKTVQQVETSLGTENLLQLMGMATTDECSSKTAAVSPSKALGRNKRKHSGGNPKKNGEAFSKLDQEKSQEYVGIRGEDCNDACETNRVIEDETTQIKSSRNNESTGVCNQKNTKTSSRGLNNTEVSKCKLPSNSSTTKVTEEDEPAECIQSNDSPERATLDVVSANNAKKMPRKNRVLTNSIPAGSGVEEKEIDNDEETQDFLHGKFSPVRSATNVYVRRKKLIPVHQILPQNPSDSNSSKVGEKNPKNNDFDEDLNFLAIVEKLKESINCEGEKPKKAPEVKETNMSSPKQKDIEDGSRSDATENSFSHTENSDHIACDSPTVKKSSKKRKNDPHDNEKFLGDILVPETKRSRKKMKKTEKSSDDNYASLATQNTADQKRSMEALETTDFSRKKTKTKSALEVAAVSSTDASDHEIASASQSINPMGNQNPRKLAKRQQNASSFSSPIISQFSLVEGELGQKHVKYSLQEEKSMSQERRSKKKGPFEEQYSSLIHTSTPKSKAPELAAPSNVRTSILEQPRKTRAASRKNPKISSNSEKPQDDVKELRDEAEKLQDGVKKPQGGAKMPQDGAEMPQDGADMPQDGVKMPQGGEKKPQGRTKKPRDGAKVPQDEAEGSRGPDVRETKAPKRKKKPSKEETSRNVSNKAMLADLEKFILEKYNYDMSK